METMTDKQTGTHVYDAKLDASSDLQSFFESDNLVVATRFFRNPPLIADLEERLVPALLKGPLRHERELRIWCAGCSDGREPIPSPWLRIGPLKGRIGRWTWMCGAPI